jgi:hypothetical protein
MGVSFGSSLSVLLGTRLTHNLWRRRERLGSKYVALRAQAQEAGRACMCGFSGRECGIFFDKSGIKSA